MSWFGIFGAAEPPQLQSTVLQEREAQPADAISELALAYEARAQATGDARQGALALLERLRDEVGPTFSGPKPSRRSVAARRVRQLQSDINRIISESKVA